VQGLEDAVTLIGREKNLPEELVMKAVGEAISQGFRKKYGHNDNIDVEVDVKKTMSEESNTEGARLKYLKSEIEKLDAASRVNGWIPEK